MKNFALEGNESPLKMLQICSHEAYSGNVGRFLKKVMNCLDILSNSKPPNLHHQPLVNQLPLVLLFGGFGEGKWSSQNPSSHRSFSNSPHVFWTMFQTVPTNVEKPEEICKNGFVCTFYFIFQNKMCICCIYIYSGH